MKNWYHVSGIHLPKGVAIFISFPAPASPDSIIKAQELMISPCEHPSAPSCRAGLWPCSALATSPAPRSTELLRRDLEHNASISFQVHFSSSCRAGGCSELARRLVSCYSIKAVTTGSCWQEPEQLALTAQPVNPHQPKPMPAKHQISHPFPQCPLFCTHSSII